MVAMPRLHEMKYSKHDSQRKLLNQRNIGK